LWRGYLPCDTRAADILYNILSSHEQRSTIITTSLGFKKWGHVSGGRLTLLSQYFDAPARSPKLDHFDRLRVAADPEFAVAIVP
jgi:hypothetical protein